MDIIRCIGRPATLALAALITVGIAVPAQAQPGPTTPSTAAPPEQRTTAASTAARADNPNATAGADNPNATAGADNPNATAGAENRIAAAGAVSLTFDDGPSAAYTPQVLDVLAAHRVKGTFCLVGTQAQRFPELVRRIVAEGHALCNHSMNHADMSAWTAEEVRADLVATNDLIRAAAPDASVAYFRAPYGSWGQSAAVAAELGMARLSWTVDPRDWSRPGVDAIVEAVHAQLKPGGIVLMHDAGGDRSQTVQALDILLSQLADAGWTFVFPPGLPG